MSGKRSIAADQKLPAAPPGNQSIVLNSAEQTLRDGGGLLIVFGVLFSLTLLTLAIRFGFRHKFL